MKAEAQRIAIAEACGKMCRICNNTGKRKQYGEHEWFRVAPGKPFSQQPLIDCSHFSGHTDTLPDYTEDLNAMHEAEKMLSNEHFEKYRVALRGIVKVSWRSLISATAAQRAEAFLRAIDKWN